MNQDEIKGVAQEAAGKLKDAAGGLTGDTGLQTEGKVDHRFQARTRRLIWRMPIPSRSAASRRLTSQ